MKSPIASIKAQNIIFIFLVVVNIFVLQACSSDNNSDQVRNEHDSEQTINLRSIKLGNETINFQINFGSDTGVLGFSVVDSGKLRYCPMYASSYRGIPSVDLEVYISNSKEELWVRSSWQGYENLAYYKTGADQCITTYGQTDLSDIPTPDILGGDSVQFPEMNLQLVTKVASIKFDSQNNEK